MFSLGNKRDAAIFVGGVLCGTVGLKLLKSRDVRKGLVHIAAAMLRAKDEVMKDVTLFRENYADIIADAHELNAARSQEAAVNIEDAAEND